MKQEEQRTRQPLLDRTTTLMGGFESPLGMELLATVDWLIIERHRDASVQAVRTGLAQWPAGPDAAARKLKLFNDGPIGLALSRLAATS